MNTAIIIIVVMVAVACVCFGIYMYTAGRKRERDEAIQRQTASEEKRLRDLSESSARSQEAGKIIDADIAKIKKGKQNENYTVPDSIVDIINKRHG